MTVGRLLILLAILIGAGIAFAIQSNGNLNTDPLYGHAVFGGSGSDQYPAVSPVSFNPDAPAPIEQSGVDSAVRANLIVAGRDIFFDANNDGRPDSSERFANRGNTFEVASADGKFLYRLTRAYLGVNPEFISDGQTQYVMLNVDALDPDHSGAVKFRQTGKINVYPEPVDHGWAHFDGPLSMELIDKNLKLPASGGPTVHLRLAISTPSVACGRDAKEKTLCSNPTALVPELIAPTATIEFPSASGEPITKRYDLDQFC